MGLWGVCLGAGEAGEVREQIKASEPGRGEAGSSLSRARASFPISIYGEAREREERESHSVASDSVRPHGLYWTIHHLYYTVISGVKAGGHD